MSVFLLPSQHTHTHNIHGSLCCIVEKKEHNDPFYGGIHLPVQWYCPEGRKVGESNVR